MIVRHESSRGIKWGTFHVFGERDTQGLQIGNALFFIITVSRAEEEREGKSEGFVVEYNRSVSSFLFDKIYAPFCLYRSHAV